MKYRALIVLAGLALVAGTGILALGWLGVWDSTSGHLIGPTGQRALGVLFFWPLTGLVVWLLGGTALLARRRFAAAAVYTVCAFAAIVGIPAIVVILPAWIPALAPVRLVTAPGWVGALFFVAVDAAIISIAWISLFGRDFAQID